MILEAFSLRAPQLFPDEGSFITLQNIKASRQLRYQHCTHVEVTPAILSWINLAQDKFRSNCSLDEKRKRFTFPRRKLLVPRYDCLLTVLPFYCRF